MLPAFRKRAKRRLIGAPKFFFFDIGIVAHLTRRGKVEPGSELFGRAFKEEYHARSCIVVSMDTSPRRTEGGIEILPWHVFLDRLWDNEIIGT